MTDETSDRKEGMKRPDLDKFGRWWVSLLYPKGVKKSWLTCISPSWLPPNTWPARWSVMRLSTDSLSWLDKVVSRVKDPITVGGRFQVSLAGDMAEGRYTIGDGPDWVGKWKGRFVQLVDELVSWTVSSHVPTSDRIIRSHLRVLKSNTVGNIDKSTSRNISWLQHHDRIVAGTFLESLISTGSVDGWRARDCGWRYS